MNFSFDDFVAIIEQKIYPFTLNDNGRAKMANLFHRYPYDLLEDCIQKGISYYFHYDANDLPTQESVQKFIDKLGGIAYNASRDPIDREIIHVKNVGKRTFSYWNDVRARNLLEDYVNDLRRANWTEKQIVQDLSTDVIRLIGRCSSWSQWIDCMEGWREDIQQWNNDTVKIDQHESIIPNAVLIGVPKNICVLAEQINASYENNLYDCTAVMMRRFMEILLVLSYQNNNIEDLIMDKSGMRHVTLDKIIKNAESNSTLALSSNLKKDMALFKDLGNYSAHKIWYNCTHQDISPHILKYRVLVEELLYKAGLK